ncbi:transposase [Roseomonas sp. GCM10028921]
MGTATEMLILIGDNPERIHSEAALATLCGACPIPASSGKTTRQRLNQGGNRQANAALYRVVIVRMRAHQPTSPPSTTSGGAPPRERASRRSSNASSATSPVRPCIPLPPGPSTPSTYSEPLTAIGASKPSCRGVPGPSRTRFPAKAVRSAPLPARKRTEHCVSVVPENNFLR